MNNKKNLLINFFHRVVLFNLVKCSRGISTGVVCYNGATCNNETDSCNCRPHYRDNGTGCLTS